MFCPITEIAPSELIIPVPVTKLPSDFCNAIGNVILFLGLYFDGREPNDNQLFAIVFPYLKFADTVTFLLLHQYIKPFELKLVSPQSLAIVLLFN